MKVCRPLDLEKVRTNLKNRNVTLKKMGKLIPIYVPSCPYKVVAENRIRDWELGRRSVPEYVYYGYAAITVDDWASDRHEALESEHIDIDYRYGSMLNPFFGELLKLEHQVKQSSDPVLQSLLPSLARQREGWKQHFKDLFGLDMECVWAEKLEDLFPDLP